MSEKILKDTKLCGGFNRDFESEWLQHKSAEEIKKEAKLYTTTDLGSGIVRKTFPNLNIRSYSIKKKLVNSIVIFLDKEFFDIFSDADKLSKGSLKLCEDLFKVHGLKGITLEGTQIDITKGNSYDWETDNIEEAVLLLLGEYIGNEPDVMKSFKTNLLLYNMTALNLKELLNTLSSEHLDKTLLEIEGMIESEIIKKELTLVPKKGDITI